MSFIEHRKRNSYTTNITDDSFRAVEDLHLDPEDSELYTSFLNDLRHLQLSEFSTMVLKGKMPIKKLKAFLKRNRDVLNENNNDFGFTALHVACMTKRVDYLKFLLKEKSLNVNCQSAGGMTPLHFACDFGFGEVVQELMKHRNIDINICDNEGNCALSYVLDHWRLDLLDLVLTEKQKILEHPEYRVNLFQQLNFIHEEVDQVIKVGNILVSHGAQLTPDTVEVSLRKGNVKLLKWGLLTLEKDGRVTVALLEHLWNVHMRSLYGRLHMKDNVEERVKSNASGFVLNEFIHRYNKANEVKVKQLKTIVGTAI